MGDQTETDKALEVINLSEYELLKGIQKTWDVLESKNRPPCIFQYADTLARLIKEPNDGVRIDILGKKELRHELIRRIMYLQTAKNGETREILAPHYIVEDMLADPKPCLPTLSRVVTTPIFTSTGSLLSTPGYDEETGIYLSPNCDLAVHELPETPTEQDVDHAKAWIVEMIGDFPFTGPAEYAHAVALFLTAFVRDFIQGQVPITVIEASTPGTGKTLLAQILTLAATGNCIEAMGEGRSDEEMRKRLTAKLMHSNTYVLLDNVRSKVASSSLASVVTTGVWEDRLLGASRTVRLTVKCIWIITGNNPSFSAEIARRSVRIRLDTGQERPWLREPSKFRHPDLIAWVKANREQLIWSALVLVRNWIAKGKPDPESSRSLGMFEDWCRIVGGILEANDIHGFLENVNELYTASDIETSAWRHFTECWWEAFQTEPVGTAELHKLLLENDIPIDIGRGNARSQRIRLGRQIGNMRQRIFGNLQVIADKQKNHAQTWRLKKII